VSACNPACPSGEECTRDLRCERRAPPAWQQAQYHERPPPGPDLTIRRHDGFYFSLGADGGFTHTHVDGAGALGAAGFSFAIGGSPVPGLAVGYSGNWLGLGTLRAINVSGFFVDVHPDPSGGFHVGTTAGWSVLFSSDFSDYVPVGWGLAPEVGYDFWVGEQWSFGLTGQVLMFLQPHATATGFSLGLRFLLH